MKKNNNEIRVQEKDKIVNPFLVATLIVLIGAFLHLSYINDKNAGSTGTNPFASIEKFVIEYVALF